MWGRPVALALLGALGLCLLLGGLPGGAPGPSHGPAAPLTPAEACLAHRLSGTGSGAVPQDASGPVNPLFTPPDCPIPQGGTLDPCSAVSAGQINCPFSTPDLNPADWLSWFGCVFAQSVLALLNGLAAAVESGVNVVLGSVQDTVNQIIAAFTAGTNTVTVAVAQVSNSAGPLAPIVTVLMWALLSIAAIVLFYFVTVGVIAFGKTVFNLL